MRQVLVRQGVAMVEDVPAPMVEPGTVLVRVRHSCISTGTETGVLRSSRMSLLKRAITDPENMAKLARVARDGGLRRARLLVRRVRETGLVVGYSAAGTAIEAGEGVAGIQAGDRVAAVGDLHAYHAEIIRVPTNLLVPVPTSLDLPEASTVALGAIALQSVRRAGPTLGETFVVIGLGIVGQLTVQMLKVNGCRVVGLDPDRARVELAMAHGMDAPVDADVVSAGEQVLRLTGGVGADGAIITAAGRSSDPVTTALRVCRKRGRVVLVGDVDIKLDRAALYQKELDVRMSTSYGPGRHDRQYEDLGHDYPLPYVRWTANRNMKEYLRLLSEGKVQVKSLITATYDVEEAAAAYRDLQTRTPKPLCVLLSYSPDRAAGEARRVVNPAARRVPGARVRFALVGAGAFAQAEHLPNLRRLSPAVQLQAVVAHSGHAAAAAAKQFGAVYAATDMQQVLQDPEVDAVLIVTRHHLHASMALQALQAGKHVLVEKPLSITTDGLQAIVDFYTSHETEPTPLLMTGFNRRFAPVARQLRSRLSRRQNPMMLTYRFNAGYLPPDHWVHGSEGGGRNIGEACHAYDLLTFLISARIRTVRAASIRAPESTFSGADNFTATLEFEDGSVATLFYTSMGPSSFPKERLEVYVEGEAMVLEDFQRLTLVGVNGKTSAWRATSKGHWEELQAFIEAIEQGGDWPIPLWEQVQGTEIAFQVERGIAEGS